MATPLSSNFTRLTSADLLKFKRYLVENVSQTVLKILMGYRHS